MRCEFPRSSLQPPCTQGWVLGSDTRDPLWGIGNDLDLETGGKNSWSLVCFTTLQPTRLLLPPLPHSPPHCQAVFFFFLAALDLFLKFIFKKCFIYLFIIFGCAGSSLLFACRLSLVAVSGGCSPVAGQGLPIAAAPLSRRTGSKVRGLSSSTACGIFPDQRSNPRLRHWPAYV